MNSDSNFSNNIILSEKDYEEKVRQIKFGILKIKLKIMIEIFSNKIKYYFIWLINQMNLKINLEKMFLESDNFLYIFPNENIKKFKIFFAFKKLLFVIKKYRYRQNNIKRNFFLLWKIQTNLLIDEKIFSKKYLNSVNLILTLNRIIIRKKNKSLLFNICFNKWFKITFYEKIKKNKISKGIIILSNIINKQLKIIFYKFPRNYLILLRKSLKLKNEIKNETELYNILDIINIDDKKIYKEFMNEYSNLKSKIKNLEKKNKLIKLVQKNILTNSINIKLSNAFYKLKFLTNINIQLKKNNSELNNMIINLKCDSLINSCLIIYIILKNCLKRDLLVLKEIFLDKIVENIKNKNTLIEYHHKYSKINKLINEKNKLEFDLLRKNFQQIFALQKIIILRINNEYFYNKNNKNIKTSPLQIYFIKWKKYCYKKILENNLIKYKLNKLYFLLFEKFGKNDKKIFFNNLILFTFNKTMNKQLLNKLILFLILKIKNLLLKIKFDCFYKISYTNKNNKNDDKYYINFKLLPYAYDLFILYKNLRIKSYILKWKKLLIKKPNYILNDIDKAIIENMSIILKEYEKEDENNSKEFKFLNKNFKKTYFLYKIIYSINIKILFKYFNKWFKNISLNNNNNINISNLYNEGEKLKIENDNLIQNYYQNKNKYKRTLYDYEFMKKHYCKNCIGEELEIDKKSITSDELNEVNENITISNNVDYNDSQMEISSNEEFNLNNNKINNQEISDYDNKKLSIEEKEQLIKEYQNEYNQQVQYYEEFIQTLENKKKELLEMKNLLLNKKKEN